jgi:hypothetical protein
LSTLFAGFFAPFAARKFVPIIPGTTITGTTFDGGIVNSPRVFKAVGVSTVRPVQLPSGWGTRFGKGRVGSAMLGAPLLFVLFG